MSRTGQFIKQNDYACWCGKEIARLVCAQMFLGRRRFVVLKCIACGTHRILPKALGDSASAQVLYNEYAAPDFSEAVLNHFSDVMLQRLNETGVSLGKGTRVLDVGCGSGFLLERICAEYGCVGYGMDVDQRRIEQAKARSRHATFECRLFDPKQLTGKYDVVLSTAVVEHVPEPTTFLAELNSPLTDGGSLFLLTPNAQSLNYRLLGSWWRELLSIGEHIYLFTPESLEACAQLAGFKLIRGSSYFDWADNPFHFNTPRNFLISLWSKYRELVKFTCARFASSATRDILYAHFRKVS